MSGKCNWCGKPTDVSFYSDFYGKRYHAFCSKKCDIEYNDAVKVGKIIPKKPTSIFSTIKVIFGILVVLFVIGEYSPSDNEVSVTSEKENSEASSNKQIDKDQWEMILQFKQTSGLYTFLSIPHSDITGVRKCEIKQTGQESFSFSCFGREYGDTLKIFFDSVSEGIWYGSEISKDLPIANIIKCNDESYKLVSYQLRDYISGEGTQISKISKEEYKSTVKQEQ